ncbi:MAG: hypothetical protein AAF203_11380, partial [Pseudomonadota bacterium]
VESETKKKGLDVFKVLYTFKRTQFVNFLDDKGESLVSVSPALGIGAELVANPEEATRGMTFNKKSIALLFGNVPEGKNNRLSQSNKTPAAQQTPPEVLAPKPKKDGE